MEGPFLDVAAASDQVVECEANQGADVQLNATSTRDDTLFTWWRGGAFGENVATDVFNASAVTARADLGNNLFTVSGTAGFGVTSDSVAVAVEDTTPPALALSVTPAVLWSPDHRMVEIRPHVAAEDSCGGPLAVELVSVTSSEPDDATGDGATEPDVQVTPEGRIYLRRERSGSGIGRTYTVTYRVTDGSGNFAEQSAVVLVPISH
jgi:hypothetical protein